jgi:tRNA A37 threonylcarbamoyladenosine dehydratase
MGAGGKIDPAMVIATDLSESYNCRLAYSLRKSLHRYGIRDGFKVVFSPEIVNKNSVRVISGERNKKSTVGTISYMPVIFGCYISSIVIRDLVTDTR